MLLLLVLTALSFFILLGAFLIVSAVRARTAARAFANATQAAAVDGIQARMLLDEALLIALRGSKDSNVRSQITESILGDKYGTVTGLGSGTLAYDPARPLATANASGLGLAPPHGRVLTFVPNNPALGGPVSFRTVGANGSTVFLANTPVRPGFPPSLSGTTDGTAYVNGREFSFTGTTTTGTTAAEPWDAYDASNPWLAQPVLSDGQVTRFERTSFQGGRPVEVDNDNDGIADGVWLNNVLPSRPSPNGTFSYRVSYLVLDLDGRININAAGTADSSGVSSTRLGLGYGPADVNPTSCGLLGQWGSRMLGGPPQSTTAGSASNAQRRPTPGLTVVGRYGADGVPGRAGDDANNALQQTAMTGTTFRLYDLTIAGTNSLADLQARVRTRMASPSGSQLQPTLHFTMPLGDPDGTNDPYEIRLDHLAPRHTAAVPTAAAGLDDSPFTIADMERLLRAPDGDAATLPQRLAATLGGEAQRARMRITTDSWDTPALTGAAAAQVQTFLTGGAPTLVYPWSNTNAIAPEVAAGLRFNLNRPLVSGSDRQEYCKGLYTLMLALGGTTVTGNAPSAVQFRTRAAQWAVNVVDFRDDDSTNTRFVYDTNLADGWNPSASGTGAGTDTVFGVERPEMAITETAAWWDPIPLPGAGQLFVNLQRLPWSAMVTSTSTSGTSIRTVENLDFEMTTGTSSDLTLANATWQLRYDTNSVAQFRPVAATSGTQWWLTSVSGTPVLQSSTVSIIGGTAARSLGPNDTICLHPPSPMEFGAAAGTGHPVGVASGTTGVFSRLTSGTVTLERLADPTQPNGPTNPYVVVDSAEVEVAPAPGRRKRRPDGGSAMTRFWRTADAWTTQSGTLLGSYQGNKPAWLHWPNRPFVSHAETVLVPADSPPELFRNYAFPPSSMVADTTAITVGGTTVPFHRLLLDAIHVPSRFAGVAMQLSDSGTCGLDRLKAHQFSSWREPGRVNVNTIAGVPALDDSDSLVWSTLVGGTALPIVSSGTMRANPFLGAAGPATSLGQVLSLTGTANQPIARDDVTDNAAMQNPFLAYATAIRLANTATIRSHVFAVWITLETTDSGDGSRTCHRLFAIVDRSIPVGFREGENLNVRDTIRLRRFLE
jgi:hypothetical protein